MKKDTLLLASAIALALTVFSGAYASDAQTATAPVAANAQPAIPA